MKKLISIAICVATVFCFYAHAASATNVYFDDIPLSEDVQTYLYNRCCASGISFDFMLAVIEQESGFRKYAASSTGDYGLCQINLKANKEMIEDRQIYSLYDEFSNIDCAITILSRLFEKYEDPSLVLMCYNLGETGARRLWDKGQWETSYVLSVFRKMDNLHYDDKLAEFYRS